MSCRLGRPFTYAAQLPSAQQLLLFPPPARQPVSQPASQAEALQATVVVTIFVAIYVDVFLCLSILEAAAPPSLTPTPTPAPPSPHATHVTRFSDQSTELGTGTRHSVWVRKTLARMLILRLLLGNEDKCTGSSRGYSQNTSWPQIHRTPGSPSGPLPRPPAQPLILLSGSAQI